MDEHMLGRYTGLWMGQIPHQRSPSRVWTNCRRVALEGRPLSGDTPYVCKGKEFLTTEDLLMPPCDDCQTLQVLSITVAFRCESPSERPGRLTSRSRYHTPQRQHRQPRMPDPELPSLGSAT